MNRDEQTLWYAASITLKKASDALARKDVEAALPLKQLAQIFIEEAEKAKAQREADKAEWDSHKWDGYDSEEIEF
jgi:hypothetical protein